MLIVLIPFLITNNILYTVTANCGDVEQISNMHFAINYSTNGRFHLLLIRKLIIIVDLVADLAFEVLYFASFTYLPSAKET